MQPATLTRVRRSFVFTRVGGICPCEQSRVEPGLVFHMQAV